MSKISAAKRALCLTAALSMLFLLILSPPHRVHHSFEPWTSLAPAVVTESQQVDHRDDHDHPATPAPPANHSDCAVLSAAQSAHGFIASPVALPIVSWTVDVRSNAALQYVSLLSLSPRSQRAPPLV